MVSTEPVRILCADPHPAILSSLTELFADQPDFVLIDTASDGREALRKSRQLAPDVVVLSYPLPELPALDLIRQLRVESPGLSIVVTSMHQAEDDALLRSVGADACVSKDRLATDLCPTIRRVVGG